MLLVLTVLTGIVYPTAVWAIAQTCFQDKAEGSLVTQNGKIVGSRLLSQKTVGATYFWPRPSADDYATVASGASNYAWTSAKLQKSITDAEVAFRQTNQVDKNTTVPAEMLTASGSGLDPDISVNAATQQVGRVCTARHLSSAQATQVVAIIAGLSQGGGLSPARINVLDLNLALDAQFPKP